MDNICCRCRHGHETKPDGWMPSQGTVWCSQRSMQMGKMRQMPCFIPSGGITPRHCVDCKKAKISKPAGESPQLGNVWCEKKHIEINKRRSMECFE